MSTLHALPGPLQDPVNGPVSIPSGVEKLPLPWVWTSSRRSRSTRASGLGRGLRSSRGISSLFMARPPWRRWPCHMKDKGLSRRRADSKGRIQHNSTLALVHHAIGLGLLYKVDTPAYTAGSGKGANKGCVVDEAVVQGTEQRPIPGGIKGVACMPRAMRWQALIQDSNAFPQPGMYCIEYTACQYAEERRCRTASTRGQAERETRCGQTDHAPTAYPRSHPTPSNQGIEALPACKRDFAKAELSQPFSTGKLKLHENAISVRRVTREGAGREFETGNRTGDTRKNLM